MADAKGFDIIRQGINSAIDIYSKSADEDFRDEHEIRQTIAKGIIKDRNNILYSDINNKLIEDISNTTHRVNWSDQTKVDEARETIFGEEGLIASAKSSFAKAFTKIPNAPNEDLNDKLILFDRQNLISGDAFTEIERKEVEARLINNFNRRMTEDIASIPESLRKIEIGDRESIKSLTIQVSENVDNALRLVNDEVDLSFASEGEAQGILKTAARYDSHTVQGIKAFAFQSIAIALVESGRDEDALDFVEQLNNEDNANGSPVEGIASYVLGESNETVSESIRSLIVKSYELDQKKIGDKANETNVKISHLEKAFFDVTQYEDLIDLNPDIARTVDNARLAISSMRSGMEAEFERLNSVSKRLYGQPSSEVRKARMQFRNAGFIKGLEDVNLTDVSSPSSSEAFSPRKSLASHISDISTVSGNANTDYAVLSAAINSTVTGGGFTSDDFLHVESILRSLNKENKPMANSLYKLLKEQDNSNESFIFPSVDQEANDQAKTLRNSRSLEDYFQKIDLGNNTDRPELKVPFSMGNENYMASLEAVIASDFRSSEEQYRLSQNGKKFVGSLSLSERILYGQTQDNLVNNPELTVNQAYEKAKRENTKSSILGNVSGTGGMDASLVETLTVGILLSEGAKGIEATGSSMDHQRRLNGLEWIPVSLESNPNENTFRIWNTNGGYWETDRDGSQIRFQLGSMVNNDLFKTAEDLEVNLQASDGVNPVTGDLQLDQALRMTNYRGGVVSHFDNLVELTGRYINSFEINNYNRLVGPNVMRPAGYEHYDEDDDINWLRSISQNGMLTPNMPGYYGDTPRLNLLLNPSPYDIEIIEETMGPDLAKKFLETGTTFKHLLDVGIARNDAQRLAYDYKKLYEELSIRLSIDSESGVDLNDYDGVFIVDTLTQHNSKLKSIANEILEKTIANDPDEDFLLVRAFEAVSEAVQDTFDSSVDLLRDVLTENAIIPESDSMRFSDFRSKMRNIRKENNINSVPKADKDLFNTLLRQNSRIFYDKDSDLESVLAGLDVADENEGKTVTIVRAKNSDTKNQDIYSDDSVNDFIKRLTGSESSGNSGAIYTDKKGDSFVGLIQFGEDRLTDFRNATGKKFTQEQFRKDVNLQTEVGIWHIKDIDKKIKRQKESNPELFEKYNNLDGLRAVAHISGMGRNWVPFLKGEGNTQDELGTTQREYYNKFSDNSNNSISSVQKTYEEITELVASGKSFTYDQSADGKTVKVTSVKDGDTFVVLNDIAYRVSSVTSSNSPELDGSIPVKETVRFAHIDTPETAKYYKGQYADRGGREAYEFTLKALNGKTVRFEPLVNPDGTLTRGHYGRALGTVITGRFGDQEIALVERGLATFRPSAEAMLPEEEKRVAEIQEAQRVAKLLGIGLWRRPVKSIMPSNENFFLKMHRNVLSEGKQRVNEDNSVTTILIKSITPIDGSNDTFLVPGYNPETKEDIDYTKGIPQFVMEAIENGELYAYPNVATAERHRESFYQGIVEGDERKLYTRNRVLRYFSSSHKWNVNKQVEKINKLTSSWDFEDLKIVMDLAYDENPRQIPSHNKLKEIYKRVSEKTTFDREFESFYDVKYPENKE